MASRVPQQRALKFLATRVEATVREGERRLPNHLRLAALAKVAPETMLKAVATMRRSGVLTVSHGKGICVADPGNAKVIANPEPDREPRTYLESLSDRIGDDIQSGRFLPGRRFPSAKVLTARYAVSRPTLRKAMNQLCRRGVAAPSLRWYMAAKAAVGAGRSCVTLIAAGDSEGRIDYQTPQTRRIVELLVNECLQSDISLRIRPYDFQTGRHVRPLAEMTAGKRATLGAIVFSTTLRAEVVRDTAFSLTHAGLPVAILDETGEYEHCLDGTRNAGIRLFTGVGTTMPGYELGRHLCTLGHRSMAYVSCYLAKPFSRNRLAGLCRAAAEYSGNVVPFVANAPEPAFDGSTHGKITKATVEAVIAHGHLTDVPQYLATDLWYKIDAMLSYGAIAETCAPLFEQALAASSAKAGRATAWVAANDTIAIAALSFLRHRKVDVPRDISIAAFDDTDEALFRGLTSYNFNDAGAVRAMLSHLLSPLGRTTPPPYAIPGFVSVRGSVRRLA
jgi:DNA-binding LacI/PurR family transcriptional regulator/DNA-binding transcriptional regulator YhcF (GntR family)